MKGEPPFRPLNPHHPTPTGDSWEGGLEKGIPSSSPRQYTLDKSMTTLRAFFHLVFWLAVLSRTLARAESGPEMPIWVQIIQDRELLGASPPWPKIEELRRIVQALTNDYSSWDALADIADVGIEVKKLLSKYPNPKTTQGDVTIGADKHQEVTFYHYGPLALGAKKASQTISFIVAPTYFYQKGFVAMAEQQKVKPCDFTKINDDDKDIQLQQLIGSWTEDISGEWRFLSNGTAHQDKDKNQLTVLGNRLMRDGHTEWIMILKDNSLELWGVSFNAYSLKFTLTKSRQTK